MTDVAEQDEPAPSGGRKGLVLGLVAAILLGGAGFYATYSGLIGGPSSDGAEKPADSAGGTAAAAKDGEGATDPSAGKDGSAGGVLGDIAFVPLDPLVISLAPQVGSRHLRFGAQLEVAADRRAEVELLRPRVADVLNVFLRAVDPRDLEDPAMMEILRAQMLRRIQLVTGPDRVRDLLIVEFVLN